MKVSISQPTVFPWIGYFAMIKNSDIFVFLDNVKFEKSSWQMRNRLKTINDGKESTVWIRIPTKKVDSYTLIKNVLIDNSKDWKQKHLKTFENNYGQNYLDIGFLKEMYELNWEKLAEFSIQFIEKCCKFLGVNTKLVRASNLPITGKKSRLVINICKELGSTTYLANIGSKEYLENDKVLFESEKIEVQYHQFHHPTYKQKGTQFIEKLSILDLLFNEKVNAKKIFEKNSDF